MRNHCLRVVCLLALGLLLASSEVWADCCAGHRGGYLAYGSGLRQAGYARPFQGIANPRYASTNHIGGPMAPSSAAFQLASGPFAAGQAVPNQVGARPFATRSFINTAALRQTAQLQMNNHFESGGQLASDADLMTAEPVESLVERPNDTAPNAWQPAYPGQTQLLPDRTSRQRLESAPRESGSREAPQPEVGLRSDQDENSANRQGQSRRLAPATPTPREARIFRKDSARRDSARRNSARLGSAAGFTSLSSLQSGSVLPGGVAAVPNLVGLERR